MLYNFSDIICSFLSIFSIIHIKCIHDKQRNAKTNRHKSRRWFDVKDVWHKCRLFPYQFLCCTFLQCHFCILDSGCCNNVKHLIPHIFYYQTMYRIFKYDLYWSVYESNNMKLFISYIKVNGQHSLIGIKRG